MILAMSSLENVDAHFIVVRRDAFEKWTHFYEITGTTSKNIYNGIVYFIHMEGNLKMFKIGYTTDLNDRLKKLQVGNPHLLCTYKTIENVSRKMETRLHRLFNEKKIRGEWFAITPDMIDSVCL